MACGTGPLSVFFFSSRRRHTRLQGDWSSDVCSSDLKEEIWKFSPFIDLSLYRSIKQRFKQPGLDWQVLFSLVCVMLEASRISFGRMAPGRLFFLDSPHLWTKALIVLATLIGVGLPLRIWDSTRMQRKLEEQERLLMEARM